jgi:hypothetical protein
MGYALRGATYLVAMRPNAVGSLDQPPEGVAVRESIALFDVFHRSLLAVVFGLLLLVAAQCAITAWTQAPVGGALMAGTALLLYIGFFHGVFFGRITITPTEIALYRGLRSIIVQIADVQGIQCIEKNNYGLISMEFVLSTKNGTVAFWGSNGLVKKKLLDLDQVAERHAVDGVVC